MFGLITQLNDPNSKPYKEMEEKKEKQIYNCWVKKGSNTFLPMDKPKIVASVDAGVYEIRTAENIGAYMFKKELHLDDLLEFPSSIHKTVINHVKEFWKRKQKFIEYGFAFKRGILLHGRAGSGKTCTINLAMKYVIEELNGIVFPLTYSGELEKYMNFVPEVFRVIEKDRPIVVIFEDIENLAKQYESTLLNVLDGLDQLENVVYLATSNYIEFLKERIINRPSRFDKRIYIPFINKEDRIYYFQQKLKANDLKTIDVEQWADDTDGMSVAHLAELIKSVIVFGNEYNDVIEELREMMDFNKLHSSNYEKETSSLGFTGLAKKAS